MRELNTCEIEEVNGGIVGLIALGVALYLVSFAAE